MAMQVFLLALLVVGAFAFPKPKEDDFEDDLENYLEDDLEDDISKYFNNTDVNISNRISGGNTAPEGAYPWMVAMVTNINFPVLMCGGSLVNPRRVLTAGHCVASVLSGGRLIPALRVVVGTNQWNSGGQSYKCQGYSIHPYFYPDILKNDVAVLFTSTAIAFTDRVRPIPLSWDFVGAGVPCRVSGWGKAWSGGPFATDLQELRKSTVDGQYCIHEVARVAFNHNLDTNPVNPNVEICTYLAVNRGTCYGDSGSALVRNYDNKQIGIVSWAPPCALGSPDVYARVSAFRDWLLTVL